MPDYHALTDLHLAILGVLWDRGEAAVTDVHEVLRGQTEVSRKTVGTLLSRLEQRGLVRHRAEAGENVYTAAVPRRTVLIARMAGVLGAVFGGGTGAPVAALEHDEVRPGDVARLRKLLRKAERDIKGER
jgi:predicted transcriptional regulator